MDELSYYVAFSYLNGVGPVTFNPLRKYFTSIKKVYYVNKSKLEKVVTSIIAQKIVDHRKTLNIEKEMESIFKSGVKV